MSNNAMNEWKYRLLDAWANGASLYAHLVMASTTADTENAAIVSVADLSDLDQCDAGGYPTNVGVPLQDGGVDGVDVTKNDGESRAEIHCDTISFTGLDGTATRDYVGILIYDLVTDHSDSPVVGYVHFTNGPLSAQATQIDVPITAAGLIHVL